MKKIQALSTSCVFPTFSIASSNDFCTFKSLHQAYGVALVPKNRAQDHTLSRNSYRYRLSFHLDLAFLITQLFEGLTNLTDSSPTCQNRNISTKYIYRDFLFYFSGSMAEFFFPPWTKQISLLIIFNI